MQSGTFRVFKGENTRQIDGVSHQPARPGFWYFEPLDYAGDVLWSEPFPTETLAAEAALAEEEDADDDEEEASFGPGNPRDYGDRT